MVALSEPIILATDTPGAKAARVNEYIDLMLYEVAEDKGHGFIQGLGPSSPAWRYRDSMACGRAALGGSAKSRLLSISPGRFCSYCTKRPKSAQARQSAASPGRGRRFQGRKPVVIASHTT